MIKNIISIVAIALMMTTTAQAERAQRRTDRQHSRIAGGVQSGSLTRKEVKKLKKTDAKVDRLEDRAMADGSLSPEEKLRIEKAQDRESRRIFRQKHDNQNRKSAPGQINQPAASDQNSAPAASENN